MTQVVYIWYKNAKKLFTLWGETPYENVLKEVVQEFKIPSNEGPILCDIYGISHNKDSFKQDVCRTISEHKVPEFRVITVVVSEDTITSSEWNEEVEQQKSEETDLSSGTSSLISNSRRIEDNLNTADNKSRLYEEADIKSSNQDEPQPAEPTHSLNEPEVDIDELQREKEELDFLGRALLLLGHEFKSRLKKRENTLNRRDIESSKLRQMLNGRDENSQEVKITCEESEAALQHYPLNKLEELLYGLASHIGTTKKQLDEHEFDLHLREADLGEKEDETEFEPSNQLRSRVLSERVQMELKMKVSKQKRRRSASSEILDEQPGKQRILNTPPQAILMDFNKASQVLASH